MSIKYDTILGELREQDNGSTTSGISGTSGTSSGSSGNGGSSGSSGYGTSGSSGTSGTSTYTIESLDFEFRDLSVTTGQTYILDLSAEYGYTINNLKIQGDTGTGTTDFYIDTNKINQLTGITFNSSLQTYTVTAENIVSSNNQLSFIVTGLSSLPTLVRGKLKMTRN